MKVKISANLKLIPGGIFFVISLILLIIAFYTTINHFIKTSEWIETNATIKEINEDDETIKISYTFEKKKYSFLSEEYSSKYNIGDKFLIYVNPNNAEEVYEHDTINDLDNFFINIF